MGKFRRFLEKFTLYELVVAALTAALGIAVKPIVVPLAHMLTGPMLLPGGVVAGGIYMLWIVLGAAFIKKRGSGTIIGIVQAMIVIATGIFGTHGALSIITYTLPGLAVDAANIILGKNAYKPIGYFTAGAAANIAGTAATSMLFFRLPLVPLLLGLCTAALSGGLGGILAGKIIVYLSKYSKLIGGGEDYE